MTNRLSFQFDGRGSWRADSKNGTFIIAVCDDGSFSVDESDRNIFREGSPCWPTLDAAKWACQARENELNLEKKAEDLDGIDLGISG